jgi:radical SAM protein with 4Fe4S-binding SPASM domain
MVTKIKDIHASLHALTPRRLFNFCLLAVSFYYSKWTKKNAFRGMPASIAIEPTTSCNLRCPECPSGLRSFTRPTGMLDEKNFQKVIDQLAPTLSYLTFYFQGEPYLHPKFLAMVAYANSQNIYTATSTNAHYLGEEMAKKTVMSGLKKLIVSIDGTTQEVYAQYRVGGKLQKALQGVENIIKWKKQLGSSTPFIVFQFLVVRPNEHQIEEAKSLAKRLGADDIKFKSAQIYDYENGSPLIPENGRYARYAQNEDGSYRIKNKLENACWKMWHSCVITWDGQAVPCCFDKDAAHPMGNVFETPFQEIWNGAAYQRFRKALLRTRKEIDICQNCTEGGQIWV